MISPIYNTSQSASFGSTTSHVLLFALFKRHGRCIKCLSNLHLKPEAQRSRPSPRRLPHPRSGRPARPPAFHAYLLAAESTRKGTVQKFCTSGYFLTSYNLCPTLILLPVPSLGPSRQCLGKPI